MNDGSSFENEVRYLLGLQGWRVRSEVLLGHKKVDGYADKISDLGYRERVVVECKDYSARLSQDVVTHRDAATRRVVHERRRPKIGFFVPNQGIVEALGQIAERKRATRAQIALAWLLAQKPWIAPIPGTTKLHRLEENLGGASVELTPEDLKAIHDAISTIDVQGDRYPAQLQSLVNR